EKRLFASAKEQTATFEKEMTKAFEELVPTERVKCRFALKNSSYRSPLEERLQIRQDGAPLDTKRLPQGEEQEGVRDQLGRLEHLEHKDSESDRQRHTMSFLHRADETAFEHDDMPAVQWWSKGPNPLHYKAP